MIRDNPGRRTAEFLMAVAVFGCASAGGCASSGVGYSDNMRTPSRLTARAATSVPTSEVQERAGGPSLPVESYTRNHPALVLPTDELRRLDAQAGRPSGFSPFAWEFARNDHLLGVTAGLRNDPYRWSHVVIEQREFLGETNGRPHVSGSYRVYTCESGRGHP